MVRYQAHSQGRGPAVRSQSCTDCASSSSAAVSTDSQHGGLSVIHGIVLGSTYELICESAVAKSNIMVESETLLTSVKESMKENHPGEYPRYFLGHYVSVDVVFRKKRQIVDLETDISEEPNLFQGTTPFLIFLQNRRRQSYPGSLDEFHDQRSFRRPKHFRDIQRSLSNVGKIPSRALRVLRLVYKVEFDRQVLLHLVPEPGEFEIREETFHPIKSDECGLNAKCAEGEAPVALDAGLFR